VAVTGVGGHAFLLSEDRSPSDALADAEIYGDRFAPAEYRHHLAEVVARRALDKARSRLEEDR
jgi:CO/xanthine dehydrogenase FAD-binding subunit